MIPALSSELITFSSSNLLCRLLMFRWNNSCWLGFSRFKSTRSYNGSFSDSRVGVSEPVSSESVDELSVEFNVVLAKGTTDSLSLVNSSSSLAIFAWFEFISSFNFFSDEPSWVSKPAASKLRERDCKPRICFAVYFVYDKWQNKLMFVECHRWFFLKPRCDRIQHGRWRRLAAVIFFLQYLQRLRFSCLFAMVWKTINCFWSSVLSPPLISQLNVRWTWVKAFVHYRVCTCTLGANVVLYHFSSF